MDTLTGIKVFRAVVESGSFVAASDRLDLSPAMVSKHVMQMEKRLGVRLLNRNSRTLSLTEPGRVYFERSKTILDDLEETELELSSLNAAPQGTLRITCPTWFASQQMANMPARFQRLYPEIVVDISFEERTVDLVEEGFDLAMRVSRDSSSMISVLSQGTHESMRRKSAIKWLCVLWQVARLRKSFCFPNPDSCLFLVIGRRL